MRRRERRRWGRKEGKAVAGFESQDKELVWLRRTVPEVPGGISGVMSQRLVCPVREFEQ